MTGLTSVPAVVGHAAAAGDMARPAVVGVTAVATLPFLSVWTRSSVDAKPPVLDEYGLADSISRYRSFALNG